LHWRIARFKPIFQNADFANIGVYFSKTDRPSISTKYPTFICRQHKFALLAGTIAVSFGSALRRTHTLDKFAGISAAIDDTLSKS
jgi:hypothetical protein